MKDFLSKAKNSLRLKIFNVKGTLGKYGFVKFLILSVVILALSITVNLTNTIAKYYTKAAGEAVSVYFEASSLVIPPNSTIRIKVDAKTNRIGFVRVVFTFDPTRVRLTGEITPSPQLGTVIEKTTMVDANSSGRVTIILGSQPNSTLPTGIFEIANFQMAAITAQQNAITMLSFASPGSNDMQVVERGEINLLINPTLPLTLTLNPAAATPTAVPTSVPTQVPTGVPSPTQTPRPSSTPTPRPSPTSLPTPTPIPTSSSYEAESTANTLGGTSRVLTCSNPCSGGRRVGYVGGALANTLQFNNVYAPRTGAYLLNIYYTNGLPVNLRSYMIVNSTTRSDFTFSPTGGFDRVVVRTVNVNLNQGYNTIKFGNEVASDAPDFDLITVGTVPAVTSTPTPPPSSGSTVVLNSATGKTCTTICSNLGKTCSSVGLDSQASDRTAWGYSSTNGCSKPTTITCAYVMGNRGAVCSGHQANWTQCRCI